MSKPTRIALILASHRRGGNTETLAEHALAHVPVPVEVDRIRLFEHRIDRYPDVRHGGKTLPDFADDYEAVLDRVLQADVLLFAAPVYWYTVPGVLKDFLDRMSGSLRDPHRPQFRQQMAGKVMYVVTVVSDEDRSVADPLLGTMRLTAKYFAMRWGGAAVGYGDRPGDVLRDEQGLAEAAQLLRGLGA